MSYWPVDYQGDTQACWPWWCPQWAPVPCTQPGRGRQRRRRRRGGRAGPSSDWAGRGQGEPWTAAGPEGNFMIRTISITSKGTCSTYLGHLVHHHVFQWGVERHCLSLRLPFWNNKWHLRCCLRVSLATTELALISRYFQFSLSLSAVWLHHSGVAVSQVNIKWNLYAIQYFSFLSQWQYTFSLRKW